MKKYLIEAIISLFLTIISGFIVIPLLKKIKAGQPIYKYVEAHKNKNGTPTMGGLFFIIASSAVYLLFNGFKNKVATVSLTIGLSFMAVGFIDDFIKVFFKRNEGLKPYQKIGFQILIAGFSGYYAFINKLTEFYVPFTSLKIDLGVATIFIVALVFIAITNSVNLTDGLDGLAGFTVFPYLLFASILIYVENKSIGIIRLPNEYDSLISLSMCLVGGVLGFLFFNVNKAKVFMGDTGSLSLGGFLGAISLFSLNGFFIPIIGIMFVLSSISVIVQVVYYKKTKRRVFLMAPLHHHLQLKGMTESQISFVYGLITLVMGCVSVIFLL